VFSVSHRGDCPSRRFFKLDGPLLWYYGDEKVDESTKPLNKQPYDLRLSRHCDRRGEITLPPCLDSAPLRCSRARAVASSSRSSPPTRKAGSAISSSR
jgi:hypothetical protein